MKNVKRQALAALVLSLSLSVAVGTAAADAISIANFHQVNERVYRGGQPLPEAWPSLAKLGVKTVIDLRREDEHSTAAEAEAVAAAGMKYINVPMKGVVAPSDEQVAKVLAALSSDEPVFIHCKRGADRTGAVIACYRIAHDKWDNKRALEEAKSYEMDPAQKRMQQFILNFRVSTPTFTR